MSNDALPVKKKRGQGSAIVPRVFGREKISLDICAVRLQSSYFILTKSKANSSSRTSIERVSNVLSLLISFGLWLMFSSAHSNIPVDYVIRHCVLFNCITWFLTPFSAWSSTVTILISTSWWNLLQFINDTVYFLHYLICILWKIYSPL